MSDVHIAAIDLAKRSFQVYATALGRACVDAPVLQGDFLAFWRLGTYIAHVSGLFVWLKSPLAAMQSENEVHIVSESYAARVRDWFPRPDH